MRLRVLLMCVLVALLVSVPAAPVDPSQGELALGETGLKETRTTEQIVPGVVYTKIERGRQSGRESYTVDVAFVADYASAEDIAAGLEADGYDPVIVEVSDRAPDDPAGLSDIWSALAPSPGKQGPMPCGPS